MVTDPDRRHRRLMIALIAGGIAVLLLVGVGIYGLLRGPGPTNQTSPPANTSTSPPGATSVPPTATGGPQPVEESGDPQTFAQRVAVALFTWDTATGHDPVDYAQVLADVGDPTGDETPGLAADVRAYLPTDQAWTQLRTYQTRQWLTVEETTVPQAWADAQAQAAPGQLLPGTTAYTVIGTRHRTGIWGTEPVESSHPVAFTVFVTCAPSFDTCRLLRLSQLDNPLR